MAKGKDKDRGKKAPPKDEADAERQAQKRIAVARDRLIDAMGDPLMRDQIVRAIRSMMKQE